MQGRFGVRPTDLDPRRGCLRCSGRGRAWQPLEDFDVPQIAFHAVAPPRNANRHRVVQVVLIVNPEVAEQVAPEQEAEATFDRLPLDVHAQGIRELLQDRVDGGEVVAAPAPEAESALVLHIGDHLHGPPGADQAAICVLYHATLILRRQKVIVAEASQADYFRIGEELHAIRLLQTRHWSLISKNPRYLLYDKNRESSYLVSYLLNVKGMEMKGHLDSYPFVPFIKRDCYEPTYAVNRGRACVQRIVAAL